MVRLIRWGKSVDQFTFYHSIFNVIDEHRVASADKVQNIRFRVPFYHTKRLQWWSNTVNMDKDVS